MHRCPLCREYADSPLFEGGIDDNEDDGNRLRDHDNPDISNMPFILWSNNELYIMRDSVDEEFHNIVSYVAQVRQTVPYERATEITEKIDNWLFRIKKPADECFEGKFLTGIKLDIEDLIGFVVNGGVG